ncbi:MAG: class I SAM-dependent methyltransferase [Anaerolineaceae bacterium]|jgi:SAM-dependent methyltransferase|nr:MAG: class I SAM-dependent methyltransferase [Anaerolineaceae bacterium]
MILVDAGIVERIVALNREFYQTFSESFSSTRYQVQPGVRRVSKRFPASGNILDVGCGNGNLMQILQKNGFSGTYVGVDFSENLIKESQHTFQALDGHPAFQTHFSVFDLVMSDWNEFPVEMDWDVICAFAVFHHIPGKENRSRIFRHIHSMLRPKSEFIFSVWQPQNSKRLAKRFQAWNEVGLLESDVDEGDFLLDWKAEQSADNKVGFRYVHIYNDEELQELAAEIGFSIIERFYSDGKGGNLGLYQIWQEKDN